MHTHAQTNSSADDIPISQRIRRGCIIFGVIFLSLVPVVISNPEILFSIEEAPSELTFTAPASLESSIPENWDPLLSKILVHETERLAITDPEWIKHVEAFISMVKEIESEGKRTAYNPSGAMSYFQFKGPSLETAYNRLINYLQRHDLGRTPQWSKNLKDDPESIYNVSEERQAVFMIINIMEQDRKKGMFTKFLSGDTEIAKDIYYQYHHTRPDQFTINRTEQKFAAHFE